MQWLRMEPCQKKEKGEITMDTNERLSKIQMRVIASLKDWVSGLTNADPKRPIVGMAAGSGHSLSLEGIVDEVDRRTPLGKQLVEAWTDLAIEEALVGTAKSFASSGNSIKFEDAPSAMNG